MRLLICTQVVDSEDPVLGFFHTWIEMFAQHCERVVVICLREGAHTLPENVEIYSLGKESGTPRIWRWVRAWRYILKLRRRYDAVFVHMNPEYALLGGWWWRRWGKRVVLWYTHKSVTWRLRMASRFVDSVCTASRESFRLGHPNVHVLGHGIDVEEFKPDIKEPSIETRVVTAGRISRTKRIFEMLKVLDALYARRKTFSFTVVGSPVTMADARYERALKEEVRKRPYGNKVVFKGPLPHRELPALYNQQDVSLNFSSTGSLDKAVLEALAMAVPVVTTNEAFRELLGQYGLYIAEPTVERIADAVDEIMNRPDRAAVVATLRNKVVAEHSLSQLIPRIVAQLQS